MQDTVIEVKKMSKNYRICKSNLQRIAVVLFGSKKGFTKHALKDVTFDVKRGERVAILGNIGSGRSTLLRILAGISFPSSGEVAVSDKSTYIMDLRAGFDSELTGRENIRSRCIALGWTKEQMKANEQWVIDFAEIEEFVDQQMKTYTSGMAGRLGFAISIALMPEILLVDGLGNVGARHYQAKCLAKLGEISKNPEVTMIYVSSAQSVLKKLCRRGIVINEGEIKFDGDIDEAITCYKENYFMQFDEASMESGDDETGNVDVDE